MSQRLFRAQILLESSQRKALVRIAREEGRSISDVARELIRRGMQVREDDPAIIWRSRSKVLAESDSMFISYRPT